MTRTTLLKAVYFGRIAIIIAALAAVLIAAREGQTAAGVAAIAVFVVFALCGRIQALFWSDLLAGLHRLNRRDYQASKAHTERFLAQLRERPWLRRLIWLGPSSYTANVEAMAINNLAAAELGLGAYEAAREHLNRAIAADPKCPLPYRNMAALILRTGSMAEARPWAEKSIALGLRGGWSDAVVNRSAGRNAAFSTTGSAEYFTPPPAAPAPLQGAFLVQILDDAATPFEFAVEAMERVFGLTGAEAIRVAQAARQSGAGACAAFDTEAEARGKAEAFAAYVQAGGHALACRVTPNLWL